MPDQLTASSWEAAADELRRLRSCLRDLAALSAVPEMLSGQGPAEIAGEVLDVLVGILRVDVAYARFAQVSGGSTVEVVRPVGVAAPERIGQSFGAWLTPNEAAIFPEVVPDPLGNGTVRVARAFLGVSGKDGVVVVGCRREDFPTEFERFLLQTAANQAVVSLRHARLLEEELVHEALLAQEQAARARAETAERRLTVLQEVTGSIASTLDVDTVLQRVVDGAKELCGGDFASIFVRDADADVFLQRVRAGERVEPSARLLAVESERGAGGQVLVTRRPFRTDDYLRDPRIGPDYRQVAERAGIVALMVVPIILGERVEGLLYVDRRTRRPFTEEDETLCLRLADQAAIAIRNAQVFARERVARREAESAEQAIREADRRKDEFLAMLSHELRNPLSAILSAVSVLDRVGETEATPAKARAIIRRQAAQLGRLVDDLLDVVRLTTGKLALTRAPVDLAGLVDRCLNEFASARRLAQHHCDVRLKRAWVDGDTVRLEQIVTNLLTNAIKYTPTGGTIRVAVAPESGEAVLRVEDTGIGVPPELLPRVFDLFVQSDRGLDRREGGLGIGLTLVRRLVELHGGRVHAHSAGPNQGSEFVVQLPLTASPASEAERPVLTARSPDRRRVLVVEDNADSRQALRALLELAGHEVHDAEDGQRGLQAALRLQPDAVFIDIGLPGLDGYALARELKAKEPGVRLIALTGYGQPEDRRRGSEAGFDAYLVKPVDLDEMLSALIADAPTA